MTTVPLGQAMDLARENAALKREIETLKAGVLCERCDSAINEPGAFFHDACLVEYECESSRASEIATWKAAFGVVCSRCQAGLPAHVVERTWFHAGTFPACNASALRNLADAQGTKP